MGRKVRYLLERDGRFFARIVIPKALRPYLENKTELRKPLGADYREATRKIHSAVAEMQFALRQAEIKAADAGRTVTTSAPYALSIEQMALRHYTRRLEQDTEARHSSSLYASMGVDDRFAQELKHAFTGKASNQQLLDLAGLSIDFFRSRGNTAVEYGTPEWRQLAIALCAAEYEVLSRIAERDEGDFAGEPSHPALTRAEPIAAERQPVSLTGLFDDYITSRKLLGAGEESERRWKPVFDNLRKFLKHDDATRLTKQDLLAWRDNILKNRSPKTVRDVWLASLRAVLNWAVREDRLPTNVAADVHQDVQKRRYVRERGFTEEEATRILAASFAYQKGEKESVKTAAAKRWVPFLAAFTGARVTELTQLRKEDVHEKNGRRFIRITPDAGSVKTGQYRDVPLHPQVRELGFDAFVDGSASGPLFFDASSAKGSLSGARTVSGRLSEWVRGLGVVPDGVQPNHAWRHRFKTLGRELGYSDRVVDAICGHAGRTAGDQYGDVTLEAKERVIHALKHYELGPTSSAD